MSGSGFDIIDEEGPCLVVSKPGGLLTQAPPHIDSLERRVKEFLKQREAKPGRVYLGVPHRLDRPVSGVLVMARHVRAARRLSEQFERRMVDKIYWALLEGSVGHDEGTWTDFVRKIPDEAQAEVVASDHPDGRQAILHYRVRQRWATHTYVELTLETGRFHQIRIQAASRGLPVMGDRQYGAQRSFGPACAEQRERCVALHARQLSFYHPMTREPKTMLAPLPDYWPTLGNDGTGE